MGKDFNYEKGREGGGRNGDRKKRVSNQKEEIARIHVQLIWVRPVSNHCI